jgi:branched-chain amino acid transport system substrate-binding protein
VNDNRTPKPPRRGLYAVLLVVALLAAACGGGGVEGGGGAGAGPTGGATGGGGVAGGGATAPAEGGPIKLGMATTLSGSIAIFGEANKNAAELAVEELNEAGGVLGREVELIVKDDQAKPEVGAQLARDLIISEQVSALLGPVSSAVALAITEVSKERKVPFITHTSNTEALTVEEFQKYHVAVVPNTGMEARAQGVDLAGSDFTSWATIAPNYEFGQRQTGTFVETLQENNPDARIVEQQFPELGESDFQPFITSILSADPEAVYSPLFAGDLVTFTQQAANLGFFDQVFFTALYETDALQELADQFDLAGIRAYSRCPFTIDTEQMQAFVEKYEERFGEVPSDWACMAYDAVKLWAAVVEEAGDLDPDNFARTVEGFEFTSLRGDTFIRPIDHQAAVPSYIGELELDEERGFYVYGNLQEVPAEEIWLSEEDVKQARGG